MHIYYQIARLLIPVVVASMLHGDDAGFNAEAFNLRLFSGYQTLRNGHSGKRSRPRYSGRRVAKFWAVYR